MSAVEIVRAALEARTSGFPVIGNHTPAARAVHRLRTVDLLSRNAEADAQDAVVQMANAMRDLPPLYEADIIVLMHALSLRIQRDNGHMEHRQELVSGIEGWQIYLDGVIDEQRAWHRQGAEA